MRSNKSLFRGVSPALLGVAVVIGIAARVSTTTALHGLLFGAIAFAFCSAIWGDAAWDTLVKILSQED